MNRRSMIPSPTARPGLTLVETLAATVLLSMIAVTCSGLLREMARRREAVGRPGNVSGNAWAELVAEELELHPERFGLDRLAELGEEPRELLVSPTALSPSGGATAASLGASGNDPAWQARPTACRAWLVSSSMDGAGVREPREAAARPSTRSITTSCWLFVATDGGLGVRFLVVQSGSTP